jgi:chromosome segregation ATPase
MCVVQVADFANRTASGALTAVVSAEVERLRTQHADAVREKSAADSKCRKLPDRVAALEGEKADLRRQLAGERRETNEALVQAQAAQAEAKLAQAEGNLARERARAAAGAAHRPGEPRGAGRGRDARGGQTDAHTAYGYIS